MSELWAERQSGVSRSMSGRPGGVSGAPLAGREYPLEDSVEDFVLAARDTLHAATTSRL